MEQEKQLKRGKAICPNDGEKLYFANIHGIRIYGADNNYIAMCPKCGEYFRVKR